MTDCRVCGSENPSDKRFCRDCGTSLTPTCPSCHAAIEPGHSFCGDCGAALTADGGSGGHGAVVQVTPGSLETVTVAERRVCSVLFVDLVSFTPLSETRDPEEVRELLSAYFERARTVIGRYGGEVHRRRGHGRVGHPGGNRR
jgi:predicted nucleic acid-binding Zn ribbon protein